MTTLIKTSLTCFLWVLLICSCPLKAHATDTTTASLRITAVKTIINYVSWPHYCNNTTIQLEVSLENRSDSTVYVFFENHLDMCKQDQKSCVSSDGKEGQKMFWIPESIERQVVIVPGSHVVLRFVATARPGFSIEDILIDYDFLFDGSTNIDFSLRTLPGGSQGNQQQILLETPLPAVRPLILYDDVRISSETDPRLKENSLLRK